MLTLNGLPVGALLVWVVHHDDDWQRALEPEREVSWLNFEPPAGGVRPFEVARARLDLNADESEVRRSVCRRSLQFAVKAKVRTRLVTVEPTQRRERGRDRVLA